MRSRISKARMTAFVISMMIVSLVIPIHEVQASLSFDSTINLSNNDTGSSGHEMAVSGSNVYVVWYDYHIQTDGIATNPDVLLKVSKDNGKSFGNPIRLGTSRDSVSGPKIATSGENVYVVWVDDKDVLFSRSTDQGSTFSPLILASNNKGVILPWVVAYEKNVYVAWEEGEIVPRKPGEFGNAEILIRVSNDNGETFDPAINLSNNASYSTFGNPWGPKIAAYGNDVYVVWQDLITSGNFDVFLARSTDNGSTFDVINLTNNSGASVHPTVAAFGNNVDVAYQYDARGRGDSYDVFFTRSTDRGESFENSIKMSSNGISGDPKIVVSGKHVYIIWQDASSGAPTISFARSTDSGKTFGSAINLSNGSSANAWLAVSGNSVYVVWQEKAGNKFEAFFRTSTDYGVNFEPAINLSKGVGDSGSPLVAASSANVYVAWMDNGVGNADVFIRTATNPFFKPDPTVAEIEKETVNKPKRTTQSNALRFSSSINLSNDDAGIAYHEIATNGSYVYVVWSGAALSSSGQFIGNADIFFRASKDNGTTFNNVINLSKNSGNSISPQIAISGNNVYLVWQDDSDGDKEIFFVRSTDNGATFSNPINLSNDAKDSVFPQIAVSGNSVYVVWQDGMSSGIPDAPLPNADILFRASTDKGATFGNIINLSKNDGYSQVPQIAVSGNNVYVVWYDTTPGNFDVFLARSTNGGASFNAINISKSSGFSTHPRIAVSGSNVYVIWFDDTNQGGLGANADIFFARSTDNGANFSDAVTLWSNNRKSSGGAQIAAQNNNVYVVWSEGETNYSRTFDVFFVRSTDNGASFDSPVNLSNNAWSSDNPVIAVSGSGVYIAWQDNTPGNGDPSKNWDAFLRMSNDNGASFGSIINVSNNEGPSFGPKVALSGDNVYVAWVDNSFGNGDVLFTVGSAGRQSTKQIPTSLEPISINYINNPKPRWGLDTVTIAGTIGKPSSMDTVTIEWGDDTISNVRIIQPDGSWGPVSHIYDLEHIGKKQIVAKLLSGRILKASSTYEVDVQKHATSLSINQIPNVKPSSPITVTGSLYDTDAKVGITSRIITFDGTGAANLQRTITFKDGVFSAKGTAPDKAATGLTIQAYFAGDDLYLPSSSIQKYGTLAQAVTEAKRVVVSNITLVDSTGNKLSEVSTGGQVLVQSNLDNKQSNEQRLVYILQIKDADGHIVFLSWVKGSLQKGQSMKAVVGWTPDVHGNYTAEVFVWESVINPKPLSEVSRIPINVS